MATKPTPAELMSWELNIETACDAMLKASGQRVISPFTCDPEKLDPPQSLPDDFCMCSFEADETDESIKRARTDVPDAEDGHDALSCGWAGEVVITRKVPLDDTPPPVGEPWGCYQKLCREIGHIRSLFAFARRDRPFGDLLPFYDFQLFQLVKPERNVDQARSANVAIVRVKVRFTPARGTI